MTKLYEFIKKHQLVAFFVLAYGISWILWIPFLLFPADPLEILGGVGVFGPALACIFVSAVAAPTPRQGSPRTRWIAFFVAWIAATAAFALYAVSTWSSSNLPILLAVSGLFGLTPAFVISSAFSRAEGVRSSLASLIKPRGGLGWHLVAILVVPAILLLGVLVTRALGQGSPRFSPTPIRLDRIGSIAVFFLYTFVYAGGINEGTGWRGFALPRLQARYSPLVASAILGFFWLLWHLPLDLAGRHYDLTDFRSYASAFAGGFLLTWVYNRSKGSILAAALLHTSANVAFGLLTVTKASDALQLGLVAVIILVERMWRKLPTDSPAVAESGSST